MSSVERTKRVELRQRARGSRPAIRRGPRQRGAVAVQVAVALTVLIGFAALTVDVGLIYNTKAQLQRAADAAALAAAAMLGEYSHPDYTPMDMARAKAQEYTAANTIWGDAKELDTATDVVFGRANYDPTTNAYTFTPTTTLPDAVRVQVRMTSDQNGPLELLFARVLGRDNVELVASATAIIVPRDIAIVADLSGSMNDDSELRNVHRHPSNLFDVWAALPLSCGQAGIFNGSNPAAPGTPSASDLQPATGPGLPGHEGGNPNPFNEPFGGDQDHGPRWGWMTTWGTELIPRVYDPVLDTGLYHIPRYSDTNDPEVIQNLIEAGYSPSERAALLGCANDSNNTYFRNRVRVLLGLAGWSSGHETAKYTLAAGNGNGIVGSTELVQTVDYPFAAGSWDAYIAHVSANSAMTNGDPDFKHRYGIKTFVNHLLEKRPQHSQTPELALTPTQPVSAVREAVQHMAELIYSLDTDDQLSLEVYGESVHHEVDLSGQSEPPHYFLAAERLSQMQAGHYDTWTCMGGGIEQGISELTESGRQRGASRKVMILLTDGKANVTEADDEGNYNVGNYNEGRAYALRAAEAAAEAGIRIFAVSHGYGADEALMQQIADITDGQHFHAEGSIDEYSEQLDAIFNLLGGKRPVELIE